MDAVGEDEIHKNSPHLSKSNSSISIAISSNELGSGEVLVPIQDYGGNGWAREKISLLKEFTFGVMNPHGKYVEQLNQFFLISCLCAIFIDPLFCYLLSANKENKCVVIDWPTAVILTVSRSITDLIYFLRMLIELITIVAVIHLLQFRLAYISPESRVVGSGDLEDRPRKIAMHYLSGYFFLDLLIVLPVPQIIVIFIQPNGLSSPGAWYAKFLLQTFICIQYVPRLYRFLPLLAGQSPRGFMFEAAWASFVINLLTFVLAGHVIGSGWYMLALLRVNRCLISTCQDSTITGCEKFIDCGRGNDYRSFEGNPSWNAWKQHQYSSACFGKDGFDYGIYITAVNLTTDKSFLRKYVYSSFWGLQQISTLGGNQIPSYYIGEVLFTMGIIGLGLLLFAILIGNMQNFLQGLGRRRLEKSLRRRDVEEWMSHRHLPEEIRRRVRDSERYHWEATRGVDEETLMENLPEDLQRDIRRHRFKFVQKVRIFAMLDEPILDAICERLRQKTYIKGGTILLEGEFVKKMIFIVRGKMESIEKTGKKDSLLEGDVCGEELLNWCLEDRRNQRTKGNRLLSKRAVKCLTNVEAFVLRAEDLEEIITLYDGFLKNHRVQFVIRNKTPYWRSVAATTIQVAWRYKKKRLIKL